VALGVFALFPGNQEFDVNQLTVQVLTNRLHSYYYYYYYYCYCYYYCYYGRKGRLRLGRLIGRLGLGMFESWLEKGIRKEGKEHSNY